MVQVREWPDTVFPSNDSEARQAVRALFARAHWRDPVTDDIVAELQKWFEERWSVNALLVAIDKTPDNQQQKGRKDGEDLLDYLKSRLRCWFDDSPDAPSVSARRRPPRQGMDLTTWLQVNSHNRSVSGVRSKQLLTATGENSRRQANDIARDGAADRLARLREKDASMKQAMDSLLPPGADQLTVWDTTSVDSQTRVKHRIEAEYAGRQSIIANDPTIRRILERLVQERRRPTAQEIAVLRSALLSARSQANMAAIEALGGGPSNDILSPEGLRIVTYLDHALAENLSLEAMTALLTMTVQDSAGE